MCESMHIGGLRQEGIAEWSRVCDVVIEKPRALPYNGLLQLNGIRDTELHKRPLLTSMLQLQQQQQQQHMQQYQYQYQDS
jgi:hypothetical protein